MGALLIAGCGYLGLHLARRWAERPGAIYGLKRSPAEVPAGIEPIAHDLSQGPPTLPADIEFAVFAAAPGGGGPDVYRATYVDGLGHLLSALERAERPPRRVLFTGSTAVYAQSLGEWVDERSDADGSGEPGRLLLEAEARLTASPLETVALRLGGLYGPGRTRLIETVLAGVELQPEPPRYTNRIHVEDAAGALVHLLDAERVEPVYNVVDTAPAAEEEVLRWLARRLDAPTPRWIADAPPPRRGNKRVDSARLRASGWRPEYPSFREGYEGMIQAMGGPFERRKS
ncbi:MAG: SDR family oxidoreductase [Planctomycetota bacterium]|jgi:nucleoside-diphosphate-sugar epimerase